MSKKHQSDTALGRFPPQVSEPGEPTFLSLPGAGLSGQLLGHLLRDGGGAAHIHLGHSTLLVVMHQEVVGGEHRVVGVFGTFPGAAGRGIRGREKAFAALALPDNLQRALDFPRYQHAVHHVDDPQQQEQQHSDSRHGCHHKFLLQRLGHSRTSKV